jgi:hypothetical protein
MNHRGYSISNGARMNFRTAYTSTRSGNYIVLPKKRVSPR